MFYIFFALLLFIIAVGVHIAYCRQSTIPGLHSKMFMMIAGACLGVYFLAAVAIGHWRWVGPDSIWGMPFVYTGGFIFILLIPVYLTFYVLTQLMSPSKKILLALHAKPSLAYRDLVDAVAQEDFIGTRLNDLCISGCVVEAQGKYRLSPSGQTIAAFLNFMQAILGRPAGG